MPRFAGAGRPRVQQCVSLVLQFVHQADRVAEAFGLPVEATVGSVDQRSVSPVSIIRASVRSMARALPILFGCKRVLARAGQFFAAAKQVADLHLGQLARDGPFTAGRPQLAAESLWRVILDRLEPGPAGVAGIGCQYGCTTAAPPRCR